VVASLGSSLESTTVNGLNSLLANAD